MKDPIEPLITEKEAAEMLGISTEALARSRKDGRIAYVPIGSRTVRYSPRLIREIISHGEKIVERTDS